MWLNFKIEVILQCRILTSEYALLFIDASHFGFKKHISISHSSPRPDFGEKCKQHNAVVLFLNLHDICFAL